MKRWLAMTAVILATTAALAGCLGDFHVHIHMGQNPTTMPADQQAMAGYFADQLETGSDE